MSSSDTAITELASEIQGYSDTVLDQDPKARAIMEDFATLPKIYDAGFEINRQNALKQLLIRGEYDVAQAIVDAYRYVNDTVIGDALAKPIPVAVKTDSGETIANAT